MFVALSWDQTINWTKTFQVSPVVPDKTTAAKASWNVIATEYQIRSGDQLLSWRIAALSGRTITINPVSQNSGQYCYSTDWKNLICNKDLSWAITNIFESNSRKNYFKKIIINNFTGTIMTWNNGQLCYKNGDMIECKINSGVFLTGWSLAWYITGWQISQFITWGRLVWFLTGWSIENFRTETQIKEIINALITAALEGIDRPEDSTITIYQWSDPKWSFTLNQSTGVDIHLDAGWSGWTTINWEDWQRCSYSCDEKNDKDECIRWHVECNESAPSCEGQCTGGWDWIPVTHYIGGRVCRYMTKAAVENMKSILDFEPRDIEWSWEIRCMFNDETWGWISIASDPTPEVDWYCVYVGENTIRCDAEWGGWNSNKVQVINIYSWWNNFTWETINIYSWGDTLRAWDASSVIYPQKTTTNVAIWTVQSNNYKLNVAGSWRIQENLKLGTYLYFEWRPITRNVFNFKQSAVAQKSSPVIEYYNDLLIRPLNIVTDFRTNNYITLWKSGNVWIGWEYSTWNIKLSVYWKERIYSVYSGVKGYVDIYNDNQDTYIISNRSRLILGLTWDSNVVWVPLPNSYITLNKNVIWLKKDNVTPSTRNPSTQAWYYAPWVQVWGAIQIGSEYEVSNKAQEYNKYKCREEIEWTIAYRSWQFYWCAKTIWNNNTTSYKWRVFDTSSLANWDAIPAPADSTANY